MRVSFASVALLSKCTKPGSQSGYLKDSPSLCLFYVCVCAHAKLLEARQNTVVLCITVRVLETGGGNWTSSEAEQ